MGFLEITYGPMFSGKSSRLIEEISQYLDVNKSKRIFKKAVIINSEKDNRNINKIGNITSHSSVTKKMDSSITYLSTEELKDINIEEYDYIAVDESQFFTDLFETVKIWLKKDKHVHCAGLISDINKNKFGQLLDLFPLSSKNTQLNAFCVKCKDYLKNATFTKLVKETESKNIIFISASEHYIPVCNEHY